MSEMLSQVDEFEQSIKTVADEYEEVADVFLGSSSSHIEENDAIANLHITVDTVSTNLFVTLSDRGINIATAYPTGTGSTVLTVEPDTTEPDQ